MAAGARLVVLGASNAARICLSLLDAARAAADGPVEMHAALGRGRSYGIRSRLLWRELGGIDDCALWHALADAPPLPTTALVMDVGNDLFYGVEVPQVISWVESCLARLRPAVRSLRLVGIPLARLRRLRGWQFAAFRRVLVPSCRLGLADGLVQAAALHEGLAALAARYDAGFVPPADAWYGIDPIHVVRRHWRTAACAMLGVATDLVPAARFDTAGRRLSVQFARPHERRVAGRVQSGAQPARRFADGSTLSMW